MQAAPPSAYEFGDFRLDSAKRVLRRGYGDVVPLTPRVFDTLLFLVENPDTVLDKERIMEAVWPDSIVEENNLTQNISTLRRVFGETPGSHRYIVTVPGHGYRFVAEVKRADAADITPPQSIAQRENGRNGNEPTGPLVARAAEANESESRPARRRTRYAFAFAAVVIITAGALVYPRDSRKPSAKPASAAPAKSIAILPFDNLSDDKQNAYFAVAVQDEILTALAQIADLKVISRMSADSYPAGKARNVKQIAAQLGVAHLVEGSVQRIGDHIRVHAQLIETRSDSHLWAQTYDRDVGDLFALQTEISTAIAEQLRVQVSPLEKAAIAQPPTNDVTASLLYAQALDLADYPTAPRAVDLLEQAVARDPKFVLAYCSLAKTHVLVYFGNQDHTETRLQAANAALQSAMRLRPDAGEVHLAAATYAYLGLRDYDRARGELELARRKLPNSAELYLLTGQIDRRQGRWNESLRNLERAVELEPRSSKYVSHLAIAHVWLRHYRDAEQIFARSCALHPAGDGPVFEAAFQPLYERADMTRVRAERSLAFRGRAVDAETVEALFRVALFERDAAAMERAIALIPPQRINFGKFGVPAPREWFSALAASMRGDGSGAHPSLNTARQRADASTQQQPDLPGAWAILSRIDAALGRKDDAIREAQHACEVQPVSKDAMYGPAMITNLAAVYGALGEKERAFEQLALSAELPGGVHYGELKLDPAWDPLRADPRFETIVASLAPK